ncbi:MAG: HPF/RaiA family ribosome-associated protein [Victivallales bacterium]|nr:HPF/RaiA family ribosome-associated protein [Victivallales bacterium]
MEVIISAKHLELDDEIRAAANKLAARLEEDYATLKPSSLRVLASAAEQRKGVVEVLLRAKNLSLHAAAKSESIAKSMTLAFGKLDTQLGRFLEKIRDNAVKADPVKKEKIWTSQELSTEDENADVADYTNELEDE